MVAALHDCPGGCGRQVSYSLYACRADWRRLPRELRERIGSTHRVDPVAHLLALGDAQHWYWEHPRDP